MKRLHKYYQKQRRTNKMSENKECLFYIDHNPPEYSGTWGGAIHKGACKVNSTDCKDTDGCFIKNLYNKLHAKEQECENLKEELRGCRIGIKDISIESTEICKISEKYKRALDEIQNIINKVKEET